MSIYTRKNAWNDGGGFQDSQSNYNDTFWYAKGVAVMMSKRLNDPTSWWFYGAIHGQYIVDNDGSGAPPSGFPNWADIPPVPSVPTTPLPDQSMISQYWDQCQHAGWYFVPWHRGYLIALENILRQEIINLGGPSNWALPYWNYLHQNSNQYQIPPAFTAATLPDGSANPLLVTARYGPQGDGNVYIPIPPVNQNCQQDTTYTDQYGGGETGFVHFGSSTGNLESNPHNLVHNYVGGSSSRTLWGLMADPGLAALDPVFYFHHANIDRLWAAWNEAGNSNPTDSNWLNGPTATGERKFYMPNPDGSAWFYDPGMVNSLSQLDYTYDDLSLDVASATEESTSRLLNLGKSLDEGISESAMKKKANPELVGANSGRLSLSESGANTSVKMDTSSWGNVNESLVKASASHLPDDVYLLLEGVKGSIDANVYSVEVNNKYVGHFSLFGLRKASIKDGHMGGAGLTIKLNISKVVDELHLGDQMGESLDVDIKPDGAPSGGEECTIDRVSVYRVKAG